MLLATWVTYGIESYNHGIELRYDEIELCFSWDRILLPFQWELFALWITHGIENMHVLSLHIEYPKC